METVRNLKAAGINVSVMVLAGLYDPDGRHTKATSETIHAMELSRGDIVYISPLEQDPSGDRSDTQAKEMALSLSDSTAAKIAPYGISAYRYFA